MTLQDFLQQGWADHDTKTADVAERLEQNLDLVTDGDGAAGFMNLAIHAVGDHLGDRARSARICEDAFARAGDDPGTGTLLFLAVARRLAGDDEGASAAQALAGDDPALPVRIGMLVAQGLMHAGDWDAAAALYGKQIEAAGALEEGHSGERACAIVSNNIATEVLNLSEWTETQGRLMEDAAQNARTYWLRIGNWVNDERADYLLSGVYTKLGRPAEGKQHADRALATIAAGDGEEKVDEAFLHLARAAACRDLGESEEQMTSIAHAESIAEGFEPDWLKQWYQEELAKAR
ncbi:MAG: hypothetical protein QNJ90_13020 [Planctomycetota bacterium]|nr:hypothetical protein [Planctomycetota bacterium]